MHIHCNAAAQIISGKEDFFFTSICRRTPKEKEIASAPKLQQRESAFMPCLYDIVVCLL